MTEHDKWLDEILKAAERERKAVPLPLKKRGAVVTAVVISKPYLVFCSAKAGREGAIYDASRSKVMELADRSAGAIATMVDDIQSFQRNRGVKQVYMRAHSETGKFPGHPWNFKMEAVLQLGPARFMFVHDKSVNAWLRRKSHRQAAVPQKIRTAGARVENLRTRAFEAACFVLENKHEARFYFDGRDAPRASEVEDSFD